MRPRFAIDPGEKRETLGRDFGIGKHVLDGGEFGFGKKLRARQPVQDRFVKRILRANARAEDPNRFPGVARNDRAEKRALYAELQRLWSTALPALPLYQHLQVDVAPRSLGGVQPSPAGDPVTWSAHDWRFASP